MHLMLVEEQTRFATGCHTVQHADRAQQLPQGQFHCWHLLVAASFRGEQWAQVQPAQQGCTPSGHSWAVARLEGEMSVREPLEAQGTIAWC